MAAVCFVYEHWRPDRGECFYVGKGSREGRSRDFRNRTRWHHAVVAKLAKLGLKVEVRIFASGLTEREAYDAERARIAYWRERGAPLVNLTDGGEGESGRRTSKATRERMRAAAALRNQDPEYREKLSEATKRSWTDERRARASEIRKGQRSGIRRGPPTEETRAKISAANKGRKRAPLSAETRAKISAANRGKVITAAQRKAISAANTGLKRSSEQIENIRAARKRSPLSAEARARIGAASKGRRPRLGMSHTDAAKEKLRLHGLENADRFAAYSAMGPKKLAKPVLCVTDGNQFESASAAARFYGVHGSVISEVCRGIANRKTAAGKVFKYLEAA